MGAEDDSAFILVEGNVVEINSYVMLDDKTAEVEEPLLLCDAQRLPSSMFQDTWERSANTSLFNGNPNLVTDSYSTKR